MVVIIAQRCEEKEEYHVFVLEKGCGKLFIGAPCYKKWKHRQLDQLHISFVIYEI